jgi:hypothetical protein
MNADGVGGIATYAPIRATTLRGTALLEQVLAVTGSKVMCELRSFGAAAAAGHEAPEPSGHQRVARRVAAATHADHSWMA